MTTDKTQRGSWTSASNAAADAACAGRHVAQGGIPETRSADADAGKAVHEALRTGDASKLTLDQTEVFDACKAIEQKLVLAVFGDKATIVSFREQRYWCRIQVNAGNVGVGAMLEHSGQADVVYRSGSKALIIDYKALLGDIEDSPKNLQLRDLACLVKGQYVVVDQVATAIVQPLVTHSPEVCLYDVDDLKRAESEMFARVAASNAPDAKRLAGERQCKFCLAKGRCAEYSAWAGAMIPTGTVEPVVKELIFQTAMESWTPSQRAIAASLLAPAAKALDEIKEYLKDGLSKDATFVPGYSLSAGTKRETIKDPQACFDRFAALGGQLPQFMGTVSVGKTKLKEAVNEVTSLKGKALDGALSKLMDGISEVSTTSGSLVKSKEEK